MNKDNKYQQLNNAFDKESSEGFNLFSDSEAYFSSIENPFLKPRPKQSSINKAVIGVELIVLTVILGGFSFINYKKSDINPAYVKQQSVNQDKDISIPIPPVASQKTIAFVPSNKSVPKKETIQIEKDTLQEFSMVTDTTQALLSNTLMQRDTVIEPKKPEPRYTYTDYAREYPLRYVANMLAINYTDTIITQPKLEAILTGTPAIYEEERYKPAPNQRQVFQPLIKTNDYLIKLEKPMQSFAKGKYDRAIKEFNQLLKANNEDQNALFYGMMAHYNEGNYSQALAYAFKTKGISCAFFEQDVDWYTALCYYKMGQIQRSIDLMDKIIHSNSFYKERAKAFLAGER